MPKFKRISKAQVRTLRGLVARVLPDDETYRAWLLETFPKKQWKKPRPSTLDLTVKEGNQAIQALIRQADPRRDIEARPGRKTDPRRVIGLYKGRYHGAGERGFAKHLTKAQADEIARLEDELLWTDNPKRLMGFIKRQTSRDLISPSGLTNREASKVIMGLRKLAANPYEAARHEAHHA